MASATASFAAAPRHSPPPPESQPLEKKLKTEDDEYDESDDEIFCRPVMVDHELVEKYEKQVEESEGFDIDYFPGMASWNFITPVVGKDLNDKSYREDVEDAIDHHNKAKQDGKLELLKVLKLNLQYYSDPQVFATFEAKDTADDKTKIYQAKIIINGPMPSIPIFREKPSK